MPILDFLYDNLGIIVGIAFIGGSSVYIFTRKTYDHSNDLTTYVVRQNQQKDSISKRTK